MRVFRLLTSVVVFVLAPTLACADGLFYKLPKDGTWATYQVDMTVETGPSKPILTKFTIRMASVGQVTVDDQLCRWIETSTQEDRDGKTPATQGWTVLVPERFLTKGEAPLEHVVRGWEWFGKRNLKPKTPRNTDQGQVVLKLKNPHDIDGGPLPLLISGPLKKAKPLPKAEIESKLGKLMCEGVTGDLKFESSGSSTTHCTFDSRLHPDAPFGLVSNRLTVVKKGGTEGRQATTMKWTLKLIDFGDGATSEIPNTKE